eukprot:TRINITY_DN9509_c0_g1_i1.p2 TRINITY_DN9509_c0_g1~~TRINITY_DN9509_c0_g1_i1.p2  ORF type:complete len:198 (-),score=58.82 TRINITY_DN9509_c0_g1_i1:57-650(-)
MRRDSTGSEPTLGSRPAPEEMDGVDRQLYWYESNPLLMLLLKLLLYPPPGREPDHAFILRLINDHYLEMDPTDVLRLIPGSLYTVEQLHPYLGRVMQAAQHAHRAAATLCPLYQAHQLKTRSVRHTAQQRFLVIRNDSMCAVCDKRVTEHTPFANYPNNTLVHLKCMSDKFVCPVTNRDFRKFSFDDLKNLQAGTKR